MTKLSLALLLVAALSSASAFVPTGQISSVPLAKPATQETCVAKKESTTALNYGYGGGYGGGGYGGYGGGYALSPRQQMRMRERDDYYGGGYGGGGYYGRGYGSRGSNGGYGNEYYGGGSYYGTTGNGNMNRMDTNSPYSRNMMVPRRGYGGDYGGYGGGYGRSYGGGGGYGRYPRDRMSRRDIYDGYNSYYGGGGGMGRRRMYGGVWNQDNDFIDPQPYRRGYGGGDMYDRGYGGGGYGYGGGYRRNQRSLMASGTMNMNGETYGDRVMRYGRESRQVNNGYGGRGLYAWD